MLAKIYSSATLGVDAYQVEVEADIQQQLPAWSFSQRITKIHAGPENGPLRLELSKGTIS